MTNLKARTTQINFFSCFVALWSLIRIWAILSVWLGGRLAGEPHQGCKAYICNFGGCIIPHLCLVALDQNIPAAPFLPTEICLQHTTSHDLTYKNLLFVMKARMGAVNMRATGSNGGSIYFYDKWSKSPIFISVWFREKGTPYKLLKVMYRLGIFQSNSAFYRSL